MAHKKGMGSTKNGRDSESKRLGAKRADGQFVLAGSLIELLNENNVTLGHAVLLAAGHDDSMLHE